MTISYQVIQEKNQPNTKVRQFKNQVSFNLDFSVNSNLNLIKMLLHIIFDAINPLSLLFKQLSRCHHRLFLLCLD